MIMEEQDYQILIRVLILEVLNNRHTELGLHKSLLVVGGGLLKLRSLQANVPSANGLTIDENGNSGFGLDNPISPIHLHSTLKPKFLMSDNSISKDYGGYITGYGVGGSGGYLGLGTYQNGVASSEALTIDYNNKIGIGTTVPTSKLQVTGGDVETETIGTGFILKSPNGTRYRIVVSDAGVVTATEL